MTMVDSDEARSYTEEKSKELARIVANELNHVGKVDSHGDILMPGAFTVSKNKFPIEIHDHKPTSDYSISLSFNPDTLPKLDTNGYISSDDNYKNINPPFQREYDNPGFTVLDFKHVRGGFCLLKDMVKVDTLNEKLKQLFPTIKNETVVRLAHKGVFPIKSTGGYLYFTDKEDKLIGTSDKDELGKLLVQMRPKENKRLKRDERAELKYFNLL